MAQQRNIKYSKRTFSDLRQQLIDYTKNYFPDTYNDFSPTSPGMMFMEMASYVGDILAFYQDNQLQETFLQYAQEPSNLYSLAYMMGYRPSITVPSNVVMDVFQRVPAVEKDGVVGPNYDYALILNSEFVLESRTANPTSFITQDKVDFSYSSPADPREVTTYATVGNTVTEYLLKKQVRAVAGTLKTTVVNIPTLERFKTLEIVDTDIIGISSIVDEEGREWVEVPYLAQDTVIEEFKTRSNDQQSAPYTLSLKKVPNRFVTRFTSKGVLQIQFGAGATGVDDDEFLPNPENVGLHYTGTKVSMLDKAFDPSNFLYSGTYGNAPTGNLTITYLVGGGVSSNVAAGTITNIKTNTGTTFYGNVSGQEYAESIAFSNPGPAQGGRDGDTVEEIRQNSLKSFSAQKRAVTKEDYIVRALSLPAKYGSIAKVFISRDSHRALQSSDANPFAIVMHILGYDQNKHLTKANTTLKTNLTTYLSQYRLLTDVVEIKDAYVINFGIDYEIIIRPSASSKEVLVRCNQALKDHFDISKWNINQPINLSKIFTLLDKVEGVQTVQKVEMVNKQGGTYSEFGYDIAGATRNNIVYPSYDPCIFELKYPDTDIRGRVTSF